VAEIRAPITLRAKLVLFFSSVTVFTSGLVLLFALSPSHPLSKMLTSIGLALALALGLVVFIVRDMVLPVVALEERSDEMARGELARPVPPAGEADEIGRLSFAFEEMRRALRDKLRSTESLNIDLEREVRRRTEVLEQRNRELHDALEKLRRAQDDLIRSEKLASMGRLVAGIAHEINNPVNAVINTLGPLGEALQTMAAAPDRQSAALASAEAEEMLRVVSRGAARTKAIVQALHNYSRGDEQRPRELSVARSVDDTLDLLRHHLRHVQIEKQIDPDLRIIGFPGQIDQVFMNLITNAAQAVGGRDQGARQRSRDHRLRRRTRDRRRRHSPHLRSVLHHQGRGRGLRARSLDRSRDRRPPWGPHRGREPARSGDDVPDHSAVGAGPGAAGGARCLIRRPAIPDQGPMAAVTNWQLGQT
jgi:signal transduction histidine kinase